MTGQQRHAWRSHAHKRARRLLGAPVRVPDSEQSIGHVTDEVFDPERQQLLGFLVRAAGETNGRRAFLPSAAVLAFGATGVTVRSLDALLAEPADERARQIVASGTRLGGALVFDERGETLGRVADALVRPDGAVVAYEVRRGPLGIFGRRSIDPTSVISVGSDALVVRDDGQASFGGGVCDSGEVELLADGSVSVPVIDEELLVFKRRVVRERVIVRDGAIRERRAVGVELRRERISVSPYDEDGVEGEPEF